MRKFEFLLMNILLCRFIIAQILKGSFPPLFSVAIVLIVFVPLQKLLFSAHLLFFKPLINTQELY